MTQAAVDKQQDNLQKKTVKIGNYVVTGKIGQGGIASIYKAKQESLNRDVAIKVLSTQLTDDPDIVRRFERESLVVANLSHPNIVHIIDKGRTGSRYYFVMDYIDGTSLREVIDAENIPLKNKIDMIVQVCKALDYAHKNGIIHRDIKPANILIDRQGNALVADFGIAQIVSTPDAEVTASDIIMGTLSYMSPEQKISSTNVDQTTDIYAIGVIIYEILCGKKPQGRFKLPSEINPELGMQYDKIISNCLAQEPKDRYQTAVELKDDLLEIMGGGVDTSDPAKLSVTGTESFLGKCRYLDTIRETSFGSTILVENRVNKKLYIIKKHSKGETGCKEAKLLSSLKHENIINIFGAGGDKKSTVIITDYAQGGSLADRMVRKYGWEKAFHIILEVAKGLDFAHKNNIIHGNIRPSNILFDADEVIKLSDFGLPIHYSGNHRKNWYSPPERKNSRQGDVYGMGVILHQMITGRNPNYDMGNNLLLDGLKDFIPDELVAMIQKMLAIRVSRRYSTIEEFLLDWDDFEKDRQEKANQKIEITTDNKEPIKNIPLWLVITIGVGIFTGIFAVLYFSGIFK